MKTRSAIAADNASTAESGSRPYTSVERNPSTMPVSGLSAISPRQRAGTLLAERAKAAGVQSAVFDRGGYKYHGRVKALADGAREGGLAF